MYINIGEGGRYFFTVSRIYEAQKQFIYATRTAAALRDIYVRYIRTHDIVVVVNTRSCAYAPCLSY